MKNYNPHITVFEFDTIQAGQIYNNVTFTDSHFNALAAYHTTTHGKYYDLGHKRIRFKEFVGVIQVGQLVIEVLPKADRNNAVEAPKEEWRKRLIAMLRAVGLFDVHAPSSTSLRIKSNSILDLYFDLYIRELEYLLHNGLAKKYRKTEGNCTSIKGSIVFNKHIQLNLVHQERVYVRHTTYDSFHQLHFILYKALRLLNKINSKAELQSRIGALLLHFPEMPDIKVTESTFQKLAFNRKTTHYQKAIEMARLLLLNYHPDIAKGSNHVLALMFDMNMLWEQFVLTSLRKEFRTQNLPAQVRGQISKPFWKPNDGNRISIRPDIVIQTESHEFIVLDTKWKNLDSKPLSTGDLRQMHVYHKYFLAKKVAIVYPGLDINREGIYFEDNGDLSTQICGLIGINPTGDLREWQKNIAERIFSWIGIQDQFPVQNTN